MPQDPLITLFGLILMFLGTVIAAALVYLAARAKNRNDFRRDTIADRDGLIDTFKETVNLYRTETTGLRTETTGLRNEVGTLRDEVRTSHGHNVELTTWSYRAIDVFTENDLHHKIPRPAPHGVIIAERISDGQSSS